MKLLLLLYLGCASAFTGLRGHPSLESFAVPNKDRYINHRQLSSCTNGYSVEQLGANIDGEENKKLGSSVSLSSDGMTVAIGAPSPPDLESYGSGYVRVLVYDGKKWSQKGSDIDGESDKDESGYIVSLSSDGMTVAIGAVYNNGNGDDSGHVRVYTYHDGTWSQIGSDINGEAEGDKSGYSVSLSSDGKIVAIGAVRNDGAGERSGHVRVFEYDGSTWSQMGSDIDGKADEAWSGYSVSLSSDGMIVAIGAPKYSDFSGYVQVFEYDGSNWSQMGSDIDAEAEGDQTGFSLSLSADGKTVAIGSPISNSGYGYYGNDKSGQVQVFGYDGKTWSQKGSNFNQECGGYYCFAGYGVSLSADGRILAVGAKLENGFSSGNVLVYVYDGSDWSQEVEINGEIGGDFSGYSVSLSADGSIVAIGAPRSYDNGYMSGQVRVMTICAPQTTSLPSSEPSSMPSSKSYSDSMPSPMPSTFPTSEGGNGCVITSLLNAVLEWIVSTYNCAFNAVLSLFQ